MKEYTERNIGEIAANSLSSKHELDLANKHLSYIRGNSFSACDHLRVIEGASWIALTAGIVGAGVLLVSSFSNDLRNENYRSALAIHADTNQNGVVSPLEEEAFKSNLVKGKGAVFVGNWPIYKTGESISTDTVSKWIGNYKSSK